MVILSAPPRPLQQAFSRVYPGHTPDIFVRAPGRVNLLGGHVDIHDGPVITIAINRDIWLAACYGTGELIRLYAADLDSATTFSLRRLDQRVDVVGDPLPDWAYYPAGVAWALQKRGLKVNAIDAVFLGNVPIGAGLSSSAAVEMAFAIAWRALAGWRLDLSELAQAGRDAERDYLHVGTGIQDQFTCLHAREGQVLWLDCRTLDAHYLPFFRGAQAVVCDTNTRRALVGSEYGQRAADCHEAAHTIGIMDRGVKKLRDVPLERLLDFESLLTESQFRRAHHVITEIARVEKGVDALQRGDAAAFGALMNESYWSARNDYGSSSPALDAMWQAATEHPACYGARYSGGGEGGAIVALVKAAAVEDFIGAVGACYARRTGQAGTLFAVEPTTGAGVFI